MSQNAWIGVVVGIIVIGGGAWWFTSQSTPTPAIVDNSAMPSGDTNSASNSDTGTQVGVDVSVNTAPMSATITYNGDSFSPQQVTIKKGGTVKWVNSSGHSMWVASAQHPSHTVYSGTAREAHCPDASGTAFDQCQPGGDYSFTFTKTGTWGYHDHLNASLFGKVVVVE